MRKIFKSKKALSPVVAAIILIAVTVAVSIAVAAWMGALTFTFMRTEELQYTSRSWDPNKTYIDLTVKNTGTSPLSMSKVEINGVNWPTTKFDFDTSVAGNQTDATTLDGGASKTVRIYNSFTSGNKYDFTIITASNNKYTYTTTAP